MDAFINQKLNFLKVIYCDGPKSSHTRLKKIHEIYEFLEKERNKILTYKPNSLLTTV